MYRTFLKKIIYLYMYVFTSYDAECALCALGDPNIKRVTRQQTAHIYIQLECNHVYCKKCCLQLIQFRDRKCCFCRSRVDHLELSRLLK